MRLLINCPSGESRLLQVDDAATVLELKQALQDAEGVPVPQQVLCFAGQHLKDHLALRDHGLEQYTLSDEVVLYLTKKLVQPLRIFLTSRQKPSQQTTELVETSLPVGSVKGLLESRGLASEFTAGSAVYVKRQDGATIPLTVDPNEALGTLIQRLTLQEGVTPTCLTFQQAQDGCMHCSVFPSAVEPTATYPIYKRDGRPQAILLKQDVRTGTSFKELSQELCVLP